jgi:hypothetical protein
MSTLKAIERIYFDQYLSIVITGFPKMTHYTKNWRICVKYFSILMKGKVRVKLFLWLIKQHPHEEGWGSGSKAPRIINVGTI